MKELACFFGFRFLTWNDAEASRASGATEENSKSASADRPNRPIQFLQGYREGEMAPVISFQDRGHGMTTERRTMAFFCARS